MTVARLRDGSPGSTLPPPTRPNSAQPSPRSAPSAISSRRTACTTPHSGAGSRLLRSTIKDRTAFRQSLDHLLDWGFDRIVLSHGRNVDHHAKDLLRAAYAFL
jgi:hypothetical protein